MRIAIENLPPDTKAEDLRKFVTDCGFTVLSVAILQAYTGSAFVTLDHTDDSSRALAVIPETPFGGRKLAVRRVFSRPTMTRPHTRPAMTGVQQFARR